MIENWELPYLAAMIDGEGTIMIEKNKPLKKKNIGYVLSVKVYNTNKELMEWLKTNFGGGVHSRKYEENKTTYTWHIHSENAYKILKRTMDYLIIKREQAELAIDFQKKLVRRTHYLTNGSNGIPLWLSNKREEYYQKLKEMHKVKE